MDKLVIGSDVIMRYCLITAKKDTGDTETLCVRCINAIPSKEEAMLFLNYVFAYDYYNEITEMVEIGELEADAYDVSDDVFINNFFEIEADDGTGCVGTFCITGVNEPNPEEALECINYSRAVCEKLKTIHWCRRIDMHKAVSNYEMNGWMWPWDVESF